MSDDQKLPGQQDSGPDPDIEPVDDQPISQFGTADSHPASDLQPLLVAPTTTTELNTLGLDLTVVACLSLRDVLFQFGSSFVAHTVGVRRVLLRLPALRRSKSNPVTGEPPPISVFGHADPVGSDEYNKQLSGRRAKAIFALLTHNVAMWEDLFNNPVGEDNWRTKNVVEFMAGELGVSASQPRKALFEAYMQSLCPFVLGKSDFLGRGADAGGKADFQGCSEFNPVVLLSTSELKDLSKEERDEANQPNRRVVLFLFRPGLKINPKLWPCPRASEPTAGCRKRFFPDGDQRRKSGLLHREFNSQDDTLPGNTFACRFYDHMAHKSPCEGILRAFRIRLFDEQANVLPAAPFKILTDGGATGDLADPNGDATFFSTFARRVTVLWNRPVNTQNSAAGGTVPASSQTKFEFSKEVFVNLSGDDLPDPALDPDPPPVDPSQAPASNLVDPPGTPPFPPPPKGGDVIIDRTSDRRLSNLGFPKVEPGADRIRRFQRELEVEETGVLADIKDELEKRHLAADPPSRYKSKAKSGSGSQLAVAHGAATAANNPASTTAPTPAPPPGATPANPGLIDEALDDKQAVIHSPKAPADSVNASVDKQGDDRAVWTFIPSGFSINAPEVLVFFHGNNNFVRAKLVGGVIKPRPPSWAPPAGPGKPNAGVVYGFDKIDGLLHQPVEMLPEVGVGTTGKFWAQEPAGKLSKSATTLGDMIDNVLERLSNLPKLSGSGKYLAKKIQTTDLKRLFVMGHSGGTIPINAAAGNTVVLSVVTDLCPYDRSFHETDATTYFNFCKVWDGKGKLGNDDDKSRFISIYGGASPDMGPHGEVTTANGTTFYHKLMAAKPVGLGFTGNLTPVRVPPRALPDGTIPALVFPNTDMVYIDHHTDHPNVFRTVPDPTTEDPKHTKQVLVTAETPPSSGNLDGIRLALKQNYKALFINTNVGHDFIPLVFTPPILEYKRAPLPPAPVITSFQLNVVDPNNKALVGANVTVTQGGAQIFAGVVPESGVIEVPNPSPGTPCIVQVAGFGLVGKQGEVPLNEPDSGSLPVYDPGKALASIGGCGGDPPVIA